MAIPDSTVVTTALGHLGNKGHNTQMSVLLSLAKPSAETFFKDGDRTTGVTVEDFIAQRITALWKRTHDELYEREMLIQGEKGGLDIGKIPTPPVESCKQ